MNNDEKIKMIADKLLEKTIARRRDFHQYPETGYAEFRTAAIVYQTLDKLGYQLTAFRDAVKAQSRMGVLPQDILCEKQNRAIAEGANPELVKRMAGGYTAIVASMCFGEGPVVGIRFDMDCVDVQESDKPTHYPNKLGFASVHPGEMHSCGHDGHTAIGLAIAEILGQLKDQLTGTVKLFFQPAEEGVRGARAIVEQGLCDDVDYMIGFHNMPGSLEFAAMHTYEFLATTKFDVIYTGKAAHAGTSPNVGKNALMAAITATANMQAIPRHKDGVSRINVGVLQAGTGRNVVPAEALMKVETRGATSEIDNYMRDNAYRIARGAAVVHDVKCEIKEQGSALGVSNTPNMSEFFENTAKRLGVYQELDSKSVRIGASDDVSYYMQAVQQHGGQAAYYVYGGDITGVHHNSEYDFNEASMGKTTIFLATVISDLLNETV